MNYRLFLAGVLCALPMVVSAANPSVQSFTVNNASIASINSGQIASFSWNITNGGGYSFLIPCTQGIKFKKADGSAFACDTPITSIATANDYVEIIAWNLSGAPKSFTARITPKDATGADYSYARQDISVSVTPIANPIESMTGATSTASKSSYTLSWSSSFLDGTNLSISCSPYIRTTVTSYTGYLPCNTPIFSSDLGGSGSLALIFDNSDIAAHDITLTLLPAMSPGAYNGAGAKSLTLSVDSNISPNPITTSFATSLADQRVLTNMPVTLTWVTEKSNGVNFRISCNDNIATTITVGNASSTPQCNTLAFNTALPASGSALISFINKSYANESITITLAPGRLDGGFDATRGKELSFLVLPLGASTTTISSPTIAQNIISPTVSSTATKTLFTKYLSRGSSNTEVRALQAFLAKDKALYPEGVVNGYFGPATERAVKRLQVKYNVANAGAPGYGAIGPKTRALLNSLN